MKLTDEQYKRADWLSINERKEQLAIDKIILEQKVEEMQKTLEFYGSKENWELPSFGQGHSAVVSDRGERARQTLKGANQ
jgi:hypothetical protein